MNEKLDPNERYKFKTTDAERAWRSRQAYIVLCILGLGLLAMTYYRYATTVRTDPRIAALKADEQRLREHRRSENTLSLEVLNALRYVLVEDAKKEEPHVLTRIESGKVLVLVQIPNLLEFSEEAHWELLEKLYGKLAQHLAPRKLYLGLRDGFSYAAIQIPSAPAQFADENEPWFLPLGLLEFYDL